jgi:hypothetical protein
LSGVNRRNGPDIETRLKGKLLSGFPVARLSRLVTGDRWHSANFSAILARSARDAFAAVRSVFDKFYFAANDAVARPGWAVAPALLKRVA